MVISDLLRFPRFFVGFLGGGESREDDSDMDEVSSSELRKALVCALIFFFFFLFAMRTERRLFGGAVVVALILGAGGLPPRLRLAPLRPGPNPLIPAKRDTGAIVVLVVGPVPWRVPSAVLLCLSSMAPSGAIPFISFVSVIVQIMAGGAAGANPTVVGGTVVHP